MHERYDDQGLVVLAISYETAGKIRSFMDKTGYTMRAGADPGRKVISAYNVRGYPSSALIGRDGKLLWTGSPYGAEHAVQKELGLAADANGALTAHLKDGSRASLEHLIRLAPAVFDVKAWAGGAEAAALPEGKSPAKMTAAKAFDAFAKGKRDAAVHAMRAHGPEAFDLAGWASARLAKLHPLKAKELQALLEKRHYRTALAALVRRKPSGGVLKKAAKDDGFATFCAKGYEDEKTHAKKGIMAKNWVFANRIARDNAAFWREISVSGMSTSEDKKRVVGLLIAGGMVRADAVDDFIDTSLLRHYLMKEIADGGRKSPAKLAKEAKKERARILADLKGRHGWNDPVK